MDRWRLESVNLTETIRALEAMGGGLPREIAVALYGFGEEVMTASKELCPVDTGNLRATGHVRLPTISGSVIEVVLGYGGTAVEYAWYVHENPEARHNAPTQWKYLETPLNERIGKLDDILANAIRQLAATSLP